MSPIELYKRLNLSYSAPQTLTIRSDKHVTLLGAMVKYRKYSSLQLLAIDAVGSLLSLC